MKRLIVLAALAAVVGLCNACQVDVMRDPHYLAEVAHHMLASGNSQGMVWLERVHMALYENTVSGMQALSLGDTDGAMCYFSMSDDYRDVVSAKANPDGKTYTLTSATGRTHAIDPERAIQIYAAHKPASFAPPPEPLSAPTTSLCVTEVTTGQVICLAH